MEWREWALRHAVMMPEERELIKNGPKSLAQAWRMQVLKNKYLKMQKNRVADPWE